MVKYLLGVLSGIVLVFFLMLLLVVVVAGLQSLEPPIEPDSVLVLRLQGSVPEHLAAEFTFDVMRTGPPPTLLDLRDSLRKAAKDDRIRAVALHCGGIRTGWAKAQELRWAVEEYRESGKPILAFLQVGGTIDYYVASAADELYMTPEGYLDLKGLRAEAAFLKDTLGKLGVEAELEQMGKYKSAAEPLSRSSMSEAYREVVNSILDEVYGRLLEVVGESRGMTVEEARQILDRGPFISEEAAAEGLVDGLKFEDEFFETVREKLGIEELNKVKLRQYRKVSLESLDLAGDHKIAVVYGLGEILRGRAQTDPFFGSMVLASDSFSETLRRVREDEEIEAVIVRINSPGGDAIASDQMWREMNLLEREKPLVVSMSDVAASGGYYMAMTKAPILAYPGTYTGSIGVVYGKLNLRGLYDKLGLNKEILTRGRFAAIDSDYRGFTPQERLKLREDMEVLYRGFVGKVAEARGRTWDEIHEIAQGRVWMGSQAGQNGLIDELGGFERAIELAKEAAGLSPEDQVTLVRFPEPKRFIELLLEGDRWTKVFTGRAPLADHSPLGRVLRSQFGGIVPWRSLLEGGMLRIAPYSVAVH